MVTAQNNENVLVGLWKTENKYNYNTFFNKIKKTIILI